MDKQKVTHVPIYLAILLLCLSIFNTWVVPLASAQQLDMRHLDQSYKVERSRGSRLKEIEYKRCKFCKEKEDIAKFEYLERALTEPGSTSYQNKIESMIFTDTKFINGCWKNADDKGIEIFFTIGESGEASDFAWFPKHRAGKCIKQHISKIEFPGLDKPHHAWLIASSAARWVLTYTRDSREDSYWLPF